MLCLTSKLQFIISLIWLSFMCFLLFRGTPEDRAKRLFSLKGLQREEYPNKVRGKNFIAQFSSRIFKLTPWSIIYSIKSLFVSTAAHACLANNGYLLLLGIILIGWVIIFYYAMHASKHWVSTSSNIRMELHHNQDAQYFSKWSSPTSVHSSSSSLTVLGFSLSKMMLLSNFTGGSLTWQLLPVWPSEWH